jgi:hypothetical protein
VIEKASTLTRRPAPRTERGITRSVAEWKAGSVEKKRVQVWPPNTSVIERLSSRGTTPGPAARSRS